MGLPMARWSQGEIPPPTALAAETAAAEGDDATAPGVPAAPTPAAAIGVEPKSGPEEPSGSDPEGRLPLSDLSLLLLLCCRC